MEGHHWKQRRVMKLGKKTTLIYEKVSPGDLGCMLQAENGSLA